MSLEAVHELRARINQSPELQAEVRPFMSPMVHKFHMVEFGKRHGFDFTPDDVEQVFDQVTSKSERELSDFELELVAGGSCVGPTTAPPPPK